MSNARLHLNRQQQFEYDQLKKRLQANPIATANRAETEKSIADIYGNAEGDAKTFLLGVRHLAMHLDALAMRKTETQKPTRPRNPLPLRVDPAAEALDCGS